MANVLNQNTIILNTEGIISTRPICVKKIVLFPSAAGDAATFTFWNESDTPTSTKDAQSTTVTAVTNTFASTANFPTATINPSQIIKIIHSATGENLYTFQIATNADNNTITTDPTNAYHGTVTDDTTELYSWRVWTPYTAFTMKAAGTEVMNYELDFGDKGRWFPNLAMGELSTSATFELFIK